MRRLPVLLIAGGCLALAAVLVTVFKVDVVGALQNKSVEAPSNVAQATAPVQAAEGERFIGKVDAPIVIIEYASLTCPHCAAFHTEILPQVKVQYIDTGKARLVFRDFPLDQVAVRGSMLARCAPPDRYFAFLDAMFRNQSAWAFAKDPMAGLLRIAKLGGLSQEQFDQCMADKTLEEAVLEERLTGARDFNVNATPTLIVNGKKTENPRSFEEFDRVLKPLAPQG
jgi:protein-disulfide isomerase